MDTVCSHLNNFENLLDDFFFRDILDSLLEITLNFFLFWLTLSDIITDNDFRSMIFYPF